VSEEPREPTCESLVIITARACPVPPPRLLAQALSEACRIKVGWHVPAPDLRVPPASTGFYLLIVPERDVQPCDCRSDSGRRSDELFLGSMSPFRSLRGLAWRRRPNSRRTTGSPAYSISASSSWSLAVLPSQYPARGARGPGRSPCLGPHGAPDPPLPVCECGRPSGSGSAQRRSRSGRGGHHRK
jgi:hypothetical protein